MYETNEFKKGLRVEQDGVPFIMVDVEFVKPGKGQGFTRVKMKNLLNGNVVNRTFKSGEKIEPADIIDRQMQFLYASDGQYNFMDNSNFEQYFLNKDKLEDNWKWLVDGMEVYLTLFNGLPVGITLPNFSILEIAQCDPAVRGDTVSNASKIAILPTGATVNVPLFIEKGDKIRIDTRDGSYIERVK